MNSRTSSDEPSVSPNTQEPTQILDQPIVSGSQQRCTLPGLPSNPDEMKHMLFEGGTSPNMDQVEDSETEQAKDHMTELGDEQFNAQVLEDVGTLMIVIEHFNNFIDSRYGGERSEVTINDFNDWASVTYPDDYEALIQPMWEIVKEEGVLQGEDFFGKFLFRLFGRFMTD